MVKHSQGKNGAYLYSAFMVVLTLLAYIPSHRMRKMLLRCLGATIHKSVRLYHGFEIRSPRRLTIGEGSIIGFDSILDARGGLEIGKNVNLSSEVAIWTAQHRPNSASFETVVEPVRIEDYAWLSFRCIILPGVCIGKGAVVAAGAVVSRDVAPFSIVAGVPAKWIGMRNQDLHYNLGDEGYLHFL